MFILTFLPFHPHLMPQPLHLVAPLWWPGCFPPPPWASLSSYCPSGYSPCVTWHLTVFISFKTWLDYAYLSNRIAWLTRMTVSNSFTHPWDINQMSAILDTYLDRENSCAENRHGSCPQVTHILVLGFVLFKSWAHRSRLARSRSMEAV